MKKLLLSFIIAITLVSCDDDCENLELNVVDKLTDQKSWQVEPSVNLNYIEFNTNQDYFNYIQASGRTLSNNEICYTLIDVSTIQNIKVVESNTEVLRIKVSSNNSDDHYYASYYFEGEKLFRDIELVEGIFKNELIASELDLNNLIECN